jgi:hypothetical protein
LNPDSLRYYAGGLVQFWRWHKPPKGDLVEVLADPPGSICKTVLSLKKIRRLKPLRAIITAPTLRPDGSLLCELGYDAATGLLYECASGVPPEIPVNPTMEQCREALDTPWGPFRLFPFCGPVDRGVHLGALLTAAVRAVLPTAPGIAYDAPGRGSGKTLLGKCVSALMTGEIPIPMPATPDNEEETRKRLFASLLAGDRVVFWDNVKGIFDSPALAAFLTSERYRDRVLGKSETPTVPNAALVVLSGNDLTLAGDMPRRILVSRIDPAMERPYTREFDFDPLAICLGARERMVAAALTLLRGWLSSGLERLGKGNFASVVSLK